MAETTEDKTKALARVETSVCGLVLNNLEDMKTVAQLILQSRLAPESFKTSEQIFVGLQTGAEIGLKPMQSLNSIVVIRGKPTLWGDAALALVKNSGLCEYCKEYFELNGTKLTEKDLQYADLIGYPDGLMAVCETKAHRDPEPVIRYFSVADAKLAKLWGKKGKQGGVTPWCTHPKRMLKYKARAFNLRDNFPDVLFGMHLVEEMEGEEPLPAPESDVPDRDKRRRLAVPSSNVDWTRDWTRAPVDSRDKLTPESIDNIEANADGEIVPGEEQTEPKSELVTFVCKECGQIFRYGKEEGQGVKCECGKGVQEKPAEPSIEEKGDIASFYIEVNSMFLEKGGKDFIEFAAYVLCIDESEVAPSKLTEDQLKQIKAYIETNGVMIS